MRLLYFFILLWLVPTLTWGQEQSIRHIMEHIAQREKVHFLYDASLNLDIPFNGVSTKGKTLQEALRLLFTANGIGYTVKGNNIMLWKKHKKQIKPKTYCIQGTIKDSYGEPLINASVYDLATKRGTLTDERGRYILYLPKGLHTLKASYLGSGQQEQQIDLYRNKTQNFVMTNDIRLQEVIIVGDTSTPMLTTQTGKRTLTSDDIKDGISLLSSPDLIKTLQRTSGVTSGIELASGLYVHGGNSDENLFLLDGTPLYQINHSLGLFSAFNTDIIKNVDFYKSGFPARYSGRISSITDVRTREGNMKETHGSVSIGLLDGRIQVEGPIIKDRTSFNMSLRRSWIDILLKPTFAFINKGNNDGEKYDFDYAFHDFNARVTQRLSHENILWLSVYSSKDKYAINDKSTWSGYITDTRNRFTWGNTNVTLGTDLRLSSKTNATIAFFGAYSYSSNSSAEDDTYRGSDQITHRFNLDLRDNRTHMVDWGIKADYNWKASTRHNIRMGCTFIHHTFHPQSTIQTFYDGDPNESADTTNVEISYRTSSMEATVYIEDEMRLSEKWSVNIGTSLTHTKIKGKDYFLLDPRLAMKYQASENTAIKLSYTRISQNVHRIASTFLEMPTDFWVPVSESISPARSTQIAVGIYRQIGGKWFMTLEGFHKQLNHLIQYRNWMGLQPPAVQWERNVTEGKGKAYGLEMDLLYRSSRITASLAYTLSYNKRYFPELYACWFHDQFDNRHKLDLSTRYHLNNKTTIYAAWTLHSGNRITLPTGQAIQPQMPGEENSVDIGLIYSKPNNFTLPLYHRLDLGVDFRHTTKRGNERKWNVSLYNAYCHRNTMYTKIRQHEDGKITIKGKGFIPCIPSISYTLKF